DAGMREYLTPASIFRVSKFETKLSWAQAWIDNGQVSIQKQPANDVDWDDKSWADQFDGGF
ncbi:hypothetical protein CGH50_25385, partial [Vibrio parahaemolyticus]